VLLGAVLSPAQVGSTLSSREPVGILLTTGESTVSHAASEAASGHSGDILFSGDKLGHLNGSATFLYCPEKSLITLASNSEVTLRADALQLTAGQVISRKPVGSCLLPQMVRVAVASQQRLGVSVVRGESEQLTAKLASMSEAQRNAFFMEWKRVEAALLKDPLDPALKAETASILAKYGIAPEALNQQPALVRSPAVELLRRLEVLIGAGDFAGARKAVVGSPQNASLLYKELLFSSVANLVAPSTPLSPYQDRIRVLLAESDASSASLEAQFTSWAADRKRVFGAGSPTAAMIESFLAAFSSRNPTAEQYEAVLDQALGEGVQMAAASAWINLAVLAIREGRTENAAPLLELAQMVWRSWDYAAGGMLADFWAGEANLSSGKLELARVAFERAAEAGAGLAGMRSWRTEALTRLARVERNSGRAQGVPVILQTAIEEQQRLVSDAKDPAEHASASQKLESLENELGDAWMAINNYSEAGHAYERATQLGVANLNYQRGEAEGVLNNVAKQLADLRTSPDSELKATKVKLFYQIADLTLNALDGAAQARNDNVTRAEIASRRLDLARQSGNRDILLDALRGAAIAYRHSGDLPAARENIRQALAMQPVKRYLFEAELGAVALDESDLAGAMESYAQVLRLIHPDGMPDATEGELAPMDKIIREQTGLSAYQGRAQALMYQGNYAQAQDEYAKLSRAIPELYAAGAQDQAELERWIEREYSRPPPASLLEAASRIRASDITAYRAQRGTVVTQAEKDRLQAAELSARAFCTVLAVGQANLLEWQNELDGAAHTYEEAIRQMSDMMAGAQTVGAFSAPLARIERERGNFDAAEKRVIAMLDEDRRDRDLPRLATTLGFSALLKLDQGRGEEARKDAEGALAVARASSSRWQIAAALQTLGKIETMVGGAALQDAAGDHLREALKLFRELGLREHIAVTLSDLGLLQEKQGKDEEALASYRESAALTELLVQSLSKDVDGSVYRGGKQSRAVYDRLIRLLIRKGRGAEALRYLETAKSRALVESLAGANVASSDAGLAKVFRRVSESQSAMAQAEQAALAEAGRTDGRRSNAKVDELKGKLLAAQTAYLAAVGEVRSADPQSAALLAVHVGPTDIMRRRLPAGTLVLEYFPDDEGLSIFAMTRDKAPVVYSSPAKKQELNRLVEEYRRAVAGRVPATETGARLYDLLIAPAQAAMRGIDTLLFVPAGNLFDLPFQALGRALPDGSIRYVIDDYAVAYLSASEQLNGPSVGGKGRKPAIPMLGLGDPDGSLPGARNEMSALQQIFPGGRTYAGADVTIERLTAPDAKYVHLATHAIVNRRDARNTYLMLSGKATRLTVQDVVENKYGLSFTGAQLLTLSACETSLGDEDPGAAYGSLSRAFARLGVPSVVASLWRVDDTATLEMMRVFYRQLAAGRSKAQALRRAQLELRKSAAMADPYYWASFVLLGM